jgi:phage protein U
MWPTDSVSLKIPAEYSAQGTLVAVDPNSKNTNARYLIDVVVSNDGTFRIERIVPAESAHSRKGHDGNSQAQ